MLPKPNIGYGSGDPETEGTNWTGTYVAKVRLPRDIPDLVPIDGISNWCANSLHQMLWQTPQIKI